MILNLQPNTNPSEVIPTPNTTRYDEALYSLKSNQLIHCPSCYIGTLKIKVNTSSIGTEVFVNLKGLIQAIKALSYRVIEIYTFSNFINPKQ